MRKSMLLIILSILIVSSTFAFGLETINVKDYIEGKFSVIFNIYLSSLGELDQEEKEFIDLLQNLPEEEQKNFAKEVYENGFSKEMLEDCRESFIVKEEEPEIKEEVIDTGKWVCEKLVDPIDDSEMIGFILDSDSGESVSGKPIRLVLGYRNVKKGKEYFYIVWHDYLAGSYALRDYGDLTPVTYRFGTEKAITKYWTIPNNHISTFYLKGSGLNILGWFPSKSIIKVIKKLMTCDQLVVRVTPYNENPVTAVFDVRGLKDVVKQFNNTLNWIEE